MARHRHPYIERACAKCSEPVPHWRRSDAIYCTSKCSVNAEKSRYKAIHPEYVKRQLHAVSVIRHMHQHGHTQFIDNPIGNPKDRFRVARSFGYRSMLEVDVARQLEMAGIPFEYEKFKIEYLWHPVPPELLEF